MDDATIKQFDTLHLESDRKQSEHKAIHTRGFKGTGTGNIGQPTTPPPEASTDGISSTSSVSLQRPRARPDKQTRATRKQNQAAKALEVTSNGSHDQPAQDSVSPQQASKLKDVPRQGLKSPGGIRTRSQRRQYNSETSKFVPQRPCITAEESGTESLLPGQQIPLTTKAATANLTLPIRSTRPVESHPQSSRAFSSPSANVRSRHIWNLRKQGNAPKIENSDKLIHLPAPEPTQLYSAKANTPASRLSTPKSLLLVLDLNGTLLYRTTMATQYVPRPGLREFLDYCFANHSVLIWSSARPHNVLGLCKKIFTPAQQKLLLGQWGRDTFGLKPEQYRQRVQVYKNLDILWNHAGIQSRHPNFETGDRWGQENTVLIDDSDLKAAAQPFNLMKVPEFVMSEDPVEAAGGVFEQVKSKLEELRAWNNVSAFIKAQQAGALARTERDKMRLEDEKAHFT